MDEAKGASEHHAQTQHLSRKHKVIHHLRKERTHEIIYMIVLIIAAIIAIILVQAASHKL